MSRNTQGHKKSSWAQLPPDVLRLIKVRLHSSQSDLWAFAGVCTTWRTVALLPNDSCCNQEMHCHNVAVLDAHSLLSAAVYAFASQERELISTRRELKRLQDRPDYMTASLTASRMEARKERIRASTAILAAESCERRLADSKTSLERERLSRQHLEALVRSKEASLQRLRIDLDAEKAHSGHIERRARDLQTELGERKLKELQNRRETEKRIKELEARLREATIAAEDNERRATSFDKLLQQQAALARVSSPETLTRSRALDALKFRAYPSGYLRERDRATMRAFSSFRHGATDPL